MYLFLYLALYMFRAHRAHRQERQIVSIQPLIAVGDRVVCRSEVKHIEKNCASRWSFTRKQKML